MFFIVRSQEIVNYKLTNKYNFYKLVKINICII